LLKFYFQQKIFENNYLKRTPNKNGYY